MRPAINIKTPKGAGFIPRFCAWVRALLSRRALLRLVGIETIILEGHVFAVRAQPLGVTRELIPALLRCSQRFAEWKIDDALYDDLIKVLSLGLKAPPRLMEQLTVPLWQLAPVIERIAVVNGLDIEEAGRSGLGKLSQLLAMELTSMPLSPGSSPVPDGHGITSNNA